MLQGLSNVTKSILIRKPDTIHINLSSNISITFEDIHKRVICVNLLVSFKILAAHVIMILVLGGRDTSVERIRQRTGQSQKPIFNENISSDTIMRVIIFSLLASSILGCMIVIIYTTTYFIRNFNMLLKCQTTFASLLSWLGIYTLYLLQQLTAILPNFKALHYKILLKKRLKLKTNHPASFFWDEIFNYILSVVSTLLLMWWVILAISFYSARDT